MKIVIIGGGGHVARAAAKAIQAQDAVTRIVFADIDAAAAEESAAALGDLGQAIQLDVRNPAMLADVLKGARCVANLAGPYFEFGPLVLQAAIDAKVDYFDICDDWEPKAEAAGITAVLGMGSSPGASNLLAKTAMDRLDLVDKVYTLWQAGEPDMDFVDAHADHRNPRRASAALVHGVMQMTGTIRAFQGGKVADVVPTTPVEIEVPELGRVRGTIFGHPEPITIPRFGRVTQEALCLCMVTRNWDVLIDNHIRPLNALDKIDYQQAADTYLNAARALNEQGYPPDNSYAHIPRTFAYAEGEQAGRHKKAAAYLTARPKGGMPEATGTPLAIAISMLIEGTLARPGVWAPEDCIDPAAFFARYRAFCDGLEEGVDVVHVAESTES
jgi:saccharopine dehydrogenase-like NADP-dependent oxidoreductase